MEKELYSKLEKVLHDYEVIHFVEFMAGNDADIDIIITN